LKIRALEHIERKEEENSNFPSIVLFLLSTTILIHKIFLPISQIHFRLLCAVFSAVYRQWWRHPKEKELVKYNKIRISFINRLRYVQAEKKNNFSSFFVLFFFLFFIPCDDIFNCPRPASPSSSCGLSILTFKGNKTIKIIWK
jgi:hypothetical protein